ncbi:MAG: sigma-70 family RNA polymerase sigma factor [Endomicrobia bacterium]|nr:sigma-70 family RNA polymerase sigma factor [Endomicrobiia bacterium]
MKDKDIKHIQSVWFAKARIFSKIINYDFVILVIKTWLTENEQEFLANVRNVEQKRQNLKLILNKQKIDKKALLLALMNYQIKPNIIFALIEKIEEIFYFVKQNIHKDNFYDEFKQKFGYIKLQDIIKIIKDYPVIKFYSKIMLQNRDIIFENNLEYAFNFFKKILSQKSKKYYSEDIIEEKQQELALCLLKAIEYYDIRRKNKFSTYLGMWISSEYHSLNKQNFTDVSLEDEIYPEDNKGNKKLKVADTLVSNETIEIHEIFEEKNIIKVKKYILSLLPPRTEYILRKRFGLDTNETFTLEDIAKELNLTKERIRQIENEGLIMIREIIRILREELKDYFEDENKKNYF